MQFISARLALYKASYHMQLAAIRFFPLVMALTACTPAQLALYEADVTAGNAAVVSAEPLVCAALDVVDPANATAICQVIDASGNVLASLTTIPQQIANITALVAKHPATTAAQKTAIAGAVQNAKLLSKKP